MELLTALQEALIRNKEISQKCESRMSGADVRLGEDRIVFLYEGGYWHLYEDGQRVDAVTLSKADFNSGEWKVVYY
jgi:hypothetical protein